MNNNILSNYLKIERKRLGFTQQQMAEAGGVSKSSQVGYEAGARVPDATYLKNISIAGANLNFILFGEDQLNQNDSNFDWNLHDSVLSTIEKWLDEQQLSLPFDKRMQLLRLFLAHFAVVNHVDIEFIHQQLRDVA